MDMSLVMAVYAVQAGNTQSQIATTVLKSNTRCREILRPDFAGRGTSPSLANVGCRGRWQPQHFGLTSRFSLSACFDRSCIASGQAALLRCCADFKAVSGIARRSRLR